MIDLFKGVKDRKKRIIIHLVFNLIKKTNQTIKISKLQEQFNAYDEKIIRFDLIDMEDDYSSFCFVIRDGKLEYMNPSNVERVNNFVKLTSDTFISLLAGITKVMDPSTGKEKVIKYTPMQAWLNGDLQTYGEGSTNDALLFFNYIFKEVQDNVIAKIGQKIVKAIT